MSRRELIAAQSTKLEQLLHLHPAQVPDDSEAAAELGELREMLRQTSVRLVLLQKAHAQALKENASLQGKVSELQRVLAHTHGTQGTNEDRFSAVRGLAVSVSESHKPVFAPWTLFAGLLLLVLAAFALAGAIGLMPRLAPDVLGRLLHKWWKLQT